MLSQFAKKVGAEKENDRCRINNRGQSKLASLLLVKPMSLMKEEGRDTMNVMRNRELMEVGKMMNVSKSLSLCHSLENVRLPKAKDNTELYVEQYGRKVLEGGKALHPRKDFLSAHDIDYKLRARMLDWMIEVASSYKFLNKTYFSCVQLLDRYFAAQTQRVPVSLLHISGVVAILIASKMEEVYPLKLKTVYEKIVHRKIDRKEIIEMEAKMFSLLEFETNSWTFFDLAMAKIYCSGCTNVQQLERLCAYVGKYIAFDYNNYSEESQQVLADTLLQTVLQIDAQPIRGILTAPVEAIDRCHSHLITAIRRFKDNFHRLDNLSKFTPESIKVKVEMYLIKHH